MKIGAFQPAGMDVDIEHLFADSDNLGWTIPELSRIRAAGRTPLLTIQPITGLGETLRFLPVLGRCLLRYGHEFNGNWYPWSHDPEQFRADWRKLTILRDGEMLPVQLIWCPNIAFPGAKPLTMFWPGYSAVDYLGLDGYNMIAGNPYKEFGDLFRPSLHTLHALAEKPVILCEVASPRKPAQADWIIGMWNTLKIYPQVKAVCWFNQDKDDGPWALRPGAIEPFLKGRS